MTYPTVISLLFDPHLNDYCLFTPLCTSSKTGPLGGGYVDGPALEAQFHHPIGLAVDSQGNVFVADTLNNRIRRISTEGMVTTLAGSGPGTVYGFDGALVNGPANMARFNDPSDVALDAGGALYVTNRLKRHSQDYSPWTSLHLCGHR